MSVTSTCFAILVLLCLAGAFYHWPRNTDKSRYKKRPLLSIAEKEFFQTLTAALPEYLIFPQVSMGAIMEPRLNMGSRDKEVRSEAQRNFWAISSKRIDFCVVSKDLDLLLLIELDDASHRSKKAQDKERDARVLEAGFSTLRFGWENGALPTAATVRSAVLKVLASSLSR